MNFSIISEPNFKNTHKQAVQKRWFIYSHSPDHLSVSICFWQNSETECFSVNLKQSVPNMVKQFIDIKLKS